MGFNWALKELDSEILVAYCQNVKRKFFISDGAAGKSRPIIAGGRGVFVCNPQFALSAKLLGNGTFPKRQVSEGEGSISLAPVEFYLWHFMDVLIIVRDDRHAVCRSNTTLN